FTSALKATWILSPRTSCTSPMPKDGCWMTSSGAYFSLAEYLRARDKSLPASGASQLVTEGLASRRSRTSRGSQEPFRGSAAAEQGGRDRAFALRRPRDVDDDVIHHHPPEHGAPLPVHQRVRPGGEQARVAVVVPHRQHRDPRRHRAAISATVSDVASRRQPF